MEANRKANSRLESIANFYLTRDDDEQTLFDVWERGGARADSVTPSTYSPEYRGWIRDKLVTALHRTGGDSLLSLGCGNAMVEAEIARKGFRVLAVDALPEAVALARAKGVHAECADVTRWTPPGRWPLIYMDGLAGHLYTPDSGLRSALTRIRSWLAGGTGPATLVISNDAPRDDAAAAEPAPGVAGFHWLSAGFIDEELTASGYTDVTVEHFRYRRPHSGERTRAVLHAYVDA